MNDFDNSLLTIFILSLFDPYMNISSRKLKLTIEVKNLYENLAFVSINFDILFEIGIIYYTVPYRTFTKR
jgi:hypothetical protein